MSQTILAQLDAQGAPVEIPRGSPFVTYRKAIEDAHDLAIARAALLGGGSNFQIGDLVNFEASHPWQALDAWGPADLQRFGIEEVALPDPPEGQVLVSYTLVIFHGSIVTTDRIFEDAPPPPRRELKKSVVMARVFAAGKTTAVRDLFAANFELQSKWFSPDWPNVYVDDEGLLAALEAVGCTAEQVAAITAPES